MSGLKEFFEKLKAKPKLRNYLIIGIFGIMLMIGASSLLETKKIEDDTERNNVTSSKQEDNDVSGYKNKKYLEKDIEEILSSIENAGRVKIMITYENGGELVTEKDVSQRENNTSEDDGEGGKRTISESETNTEVVYQDSGSNKSPFVKSEIYPKIRGVVVVAEGGDNEIVAGKITRALEVLLDLPVHKIQVTK